jgi:phage terminase small subunit
MSRADTTPGQVIPRAHMLVIDEYMKDCNQRQAMLRAGYSVSAADSRRARHTIFGNPVVQQEIARRQNAVSEKHEIDRDKIIRKLMEIAFAEIKDFIIVTEDGWLNYDFTKATPADLAAIDSITVDQYVEGRGEGARTVKKLKINKKDQLRAIEMLIKIGGLYNETLTVKGELTLVERLQAGRARIKQPVIESQVIDAC